MDISGIGQSQTSSTTAADAKQTVQMGAFEAALKKAAESGDQTALKKACQDFESIFVQMVFKNMRSMETADPLIEKSQAQEIFEGMLDEELSKKVSSVGGMGIADMLFNQLEKKYGPKDEKTPGLDLKG